MEFNSKFAVKLQVMIIIICTFVAILDTWYSRAYYYVVVYVSDECYHLLIM